MRKALFFDVDGTLLSADHVIPASALQALKRTREKGNLVFVNSGRTRGLLTKLMQEIPADGFLCGCGTELIYQGKQLYYYTLSDERKEEILSYQEKYGLACLLEGELGTYYSVPEIIYEKHPTLREKTEYELLFVKNENGLRSAAEIKDAVISKFCFFRCETTDLSGMYRETAGKFDLIDRGSDFFECVPVGHGKGAAVDRILQILGIEKENSYAFGDSANDVDMFLHSGHNIVMGKHDDVVEPYAEYITDTVENDGIWKAMEHYHLL